MRTCKICNKTKEESEFYICSYKSKSGKIYYAGRCKECDNKRRKKLFYDNHEKYLVKNRQYYDEHKEQWTNYNQWDQTPEGKARKIELQKIRRAKNRKQYLAQKKFGRACKAGKIERPKKCELCGKENYKIIGHHDDYDKPFDVQWICEECHAAIHIKKSRVLVSA